MRSQALGDVLVHRHGRRKHMTADIGNPGDLEQALHRSVLAVGTV